MKLLIVNALQLASLAIVFIVLTRLARAGRSPRLLLLMAAAAGLVIGKYLFTRSEPWDKFADFRDAYWPAGRLVLQGPSHLEPMLRLGSDGFVNFPIVAYLFAPLGALPVQLAERVFFALGVASVIGVWLLLVRMYELAVFERALVLYLLLSFGPLLYSMREGNTSHILLLVFLWALLLLRTGRDLAGGALLGAVAFIKLPMLLLGAYFALRRRWRAFAGYWGAFGALTGLSLLLFGWRMHVIWYQGCIKPYARDPVPAFNAQSFASALSRFELGGSHLRDWSPHALSIGGRFWVGAVSIVLLGLPLWAAWRNRRASRDALAIENELLALSVLSCLISALCWSHYYVWLVPAAVFLLARWRSKAGRALIALAWLLAQPAVFLDGPLGSGVLGLLLLVLRSHLLWGAMLLYLCLVWVQARPAEQSA